MHDHYLVHNLGAWGKEWYNEGLRKGGMSAAMCFCSKGPDMYNWLSLVEYCVSSSSNLIFVGVF